MGNDSEKKQIYIYGAGGLGIVAADIASENGWDVLAFIDDDVSRSSFLGLPVVSPSDHNVARRIKESDGLILCISNSSIRRTLAEQWSQHVLSVMHQSLLVSSSSVISKGCLGFHGAIVQANVSIGSCVVLNTGCSVDHDCVIGDFVHIAPKATLCGYVTVGHNSEIGAGAVVLPGLTVGSNVKVGAGAVVTKNIPDNITVVGCPARDVCHRND